MNDAEAMGGPDRTNNTRLDIFDPDALQRAVIHARTPRRQLRARGAAAIVIAGRPTKPNQDGLDRPLSMDA